MTVTPSDLDIQRIGIDAVLRELHTCMPAEIVRIHSGDHALQFVDVLPSLQREVPNEDGELIMESLPVIPMLPVAYLQGGGFFISVPLAVGDIVLVLFAERSLDQWIETARKSSKRTVNPGDVGMHTLQGAIALPCGPAPRPELIADVHASNLVIGLDGAGPEGQIQITPDGEIHLGGNSDYVALAAMVLARLQAIKTAFDAHIHTVPISGPAGTTTSTPPASPMGAPASVASSKVKVT